MGLLDKLKNVFFEEEYVEVDDNKVSRKQRVEKEERGHIARKVEVPKKEVKEVVQVIGDTDDEFVEKSSKEVLSDRELLKSDASFKFYEDDDFVDKEKVVTVKSVPPIDRTEVSRVPYGGGDQIDLHHLESHYKVEKAEKEFRPTPIISPIYGVLDKNYSKEDIVDKKERRVPSSYARKIDLDSVRKKAYGELSHELDLGGDDILSEVVEEDEIEDNLLYDMSDTDTTPMVEKVTLADAEEYFEDLGLEYNIDYKDKAQEKARGRRVNHASVVDNYVEEVKEIQEVQEVNQDRALEDNLFDLIDSMYEDKE